MSKWFDEKFERERLRAYTKRNLQKGFFDNFLRRFSVTNWIIIVNFAVFLLCFALIEIFGSEKVIPVIALQSNSFFAGNYWILLTSMFIHIEIWHLLANMVSLFFVGCFVERLIGRKRFFWLYILSGIFAGIFYVFLSYYFGAGGIGGKLFGNPEVFAVGASGAVFSLLGLLAILTPNAKVYLIAGPILALIFQAVFLGIFPDSGISSVLNIVITLYILFAIFSMFSFNSKMSAISIPVKLSFWVLPFVAIVPLVVVGLFVDLPIGNSAHFGGLIAGLGFGMYLKNKYRKKTELINKYFSR